MSWGEAIKSVAANPLTWAIPLMGVLVILIGERALMIYRVDKLEDRVDKMAEVQTVFASNIEGIDRDISWIRQHLENQARKDSNSGLH